MTDTVDLTDQAPAEAYSAIDQFVFQVTNSVLDSLPQFSRNFLGHFEYPNNAPMDSNQQISTSGSLKTMKYTF